MKKGFSAEKYIDAQTKAVFNRIKEFDKLYLEIGGKLVYDMHASRVLPGFKKTTKIELLKKLGKLEIIYCVNAKDLEGKSHLADFDLTYEKQCLKDISDIEKYGLKVNHLCITRFEDEEKAWKFREKILRKKIPVYFHREIPGYPKNISKIISGYAKQPFIPTKTKLVIVTGPAGNSGKMATALTQVYNERRKGVKAGYSKYELFPIWNLPLNHPVNLAYEAATANLGDINMIDPYNYSAYHVKAINYNRDIENFKILKKIYEKATNKKSALRFKSPTDMGINMAKKGIIDDEICRRRAIKEIKRRYKIYYKEYKKGRERKKTLDRMYEIMKHSMIK